MLAFIFLFVLPLQILGAHVSIQNHLKNSTRNFCDENVKWIPVKYKEVHITTPHKDDIGIRAQEKSCITFPYNPEAHSVIIIHVFMQVSSFSSGVEVSLFRAAETSPYETYVYKRADDPISGQWYDLVIHAERDTHFIRLSGSSLNQDIIIVDSFESVSSDLMELEKHNKNNLVAPVEIIEQGDTFIFHNVREKRSNDEDELEDKAVTDNPAAAEDNDENSFWTPLTIALISIGGVAVAAGLMGAAYYCGVSKSESLLVENFEDSPSTVTIPRVRGVYD